MSETNGSKGLIHLYCGDGKGKTTAAMGLAIRAAGSGMRVVFLQFLKGRPVSELNSLKLIPGITVIRNNKDYGFYNTMSEQDKKDITKLHNENLYKARALVEQGEVDLLVLDEVCAAYRYPLLDTEAIKELILHKRQGLELVLTGRNPDSLFVEQADYISEIQKVKHPFDKNIHARKGIEY
ncbi:cob(I)yrinic acid a,c-diamide adenosyltransferase [Anaerocolumna cellulosilytica]|uniref:Cob(I)yrinic acid a,c-diamide adenosyltransferase n=1 Tax=Anaerocolumna cellulosilytica TaxID=433286 RepID=A0A6S6R2L6_9FIRM|nr:cob(I)yrinic acid a,c-diamide adenosyltransferase [Anaerocolumna cellulosilytica]MBB5196358.1 cob(I)alamin adenosyltransferase [Anaerocolumna cellulosilytica]BCJ96386.1 cob(I)yrinic acid a,c-diamide adenosyltransferase [Anaerocolumna cellulosilytica]